MPLKKISEVGAIGNTYLFYSPCPRQYVLLTVNTGDYEFTLKTFQCPAEFSQQSESPVNHNTASS